MSTDPWVHRYLQEKARQAAADFGGRVVVVTRFAQSPVRGLLLRDDGMGSLVIAGYGVVAMAEVESVTV